MNKDVSQDDIDIMIDSMLNKNGNHRKNVKNGQNGQQVIQPIEYQNLCTHYTKGYEVIFNPIK